MKRIIWCLLVIGSCQRSDFTFDSTKLYTPSELNAKATGKCERMQAWEGQVVQVRGRIDQPALYETQNGGKFWLRDGKSFIQVYVQGASAEDLQSLYTQVVKGLEVTVTGKAVAVEMRTQFKCKKSLYVEIRQAEAIDF